LTLLQNGITSTPEGQNINYTNRYVVGNCNAVSNYRITDTLPSNVTFVSANNGGVYNNANRVVSWTVNQAMSTTVDYDFIVSINAGAYYAPITVLNENVSSVPPLLPAGWSTSSSPTMNPWLTSVAQSQSLPNSFFTSDLPTANDQNLFNSTNLSLPASPMNLTFWSSVNSEASWDGGVVEISTNNGSTWTDLGSRMASGGYNGTLGSGTNPLAGRSAFTGNSNGFLKTTVNLASYASQNIKLRFRFGSDESVGGLGWYVDDIAIQSVAHVDMRSNQFNASNVRIGYSDSVMLITSLGCTPPVAGTVTGTSSICLFESPTFSSNGDGGGVWSSSNETVATVNPASGIVFGIGAGTSTIAYTVNNGCGAPATSSKVITVTDMVHAGNVTGPASMCMGTSSTFTSDGTPGGVWWSLDPAVVTVNASTGKVTAMSSGIVTVAYKVTGCGGADSSWTNIIVTSCGCTGYTVLGLSDVKLGENNVVTGDVGNTGAGKRVSISKNSSVTGSIRASVITLQSPVTVSGSLNYSPAVVTLPPMLLNTAVVPSGSFSVPDNGSATISTNYNSLTIGKNATVTVAGSIYGTLYIKQGATVTFNNSEISIDDLKTDAGSSSPLKYTTINFTADANIRIKNSVIVNARNRINETNSKRVTFYLGDNSGSAESFDVTGIDTKITAGIYMPIGKLNITNNGPCTMTGSIIVQNIVSQRGVTWNCGNSIPLTEMPTLDELYSNDVFSVRVSPNPSRTTFRIQTISKSDEPVMIRVIDQAGRVVSTELNTAAKQPMIIGSRLQAGLYYAEVRQGDNVQTVKLVKVN
jgi:hypothetical protein